MITASEILEKLKKKDMETLIGTALQVAYEYPDWGETHVQDMYDTFKQTGTKVKFSADDLYDATVEADKLKKAGKQWRDAEKAMLKMKLT